MIMYEKHEDGNGKSSVIEYHTITHIFQIPYPKEIVVQRATLDLT